MKPGTTIRKVKPVKETICSLHKHIAKFALGLDRQANLSEIRKDKPRSAPLNLLDMVF